MTTDGKKRLIRFAYRAVVSLIWVVLAAVCLETWEIARSFLADRAYAKYFDSQNAKVYGMAPAEDVAAVIAEWRDVPAAHVPPPPPPVPSEEQTQRRAQYAAISTENRNTIATLGGYFEAHFAPDGTLLESWGEPFAGLDLFKYQRRLPGCSGLWAQMLREAQETPETRRYAFSVPVGIPNFYDATVTPIRNADGHLEKTIVRIQDITASKSLAERNGGAVPDENSDWEVTFFSHKKNWSQPGGMISTNNMGFRDEDVVLPKPAGVVRIVCIGGSTTEEGNNNEQTYPNMVERLLRARFGTDKIEVVNCGICGMNSFLMRKRIDDYLTLEPDLILYYGPVNDITHVYFSVWLEQMSPTMKCLLHSKFLKRWLNRRVLPSDDEITEFLNNTTYRNLRAMAYAAREKGVPVAIASFAYPTFGRFNLFAGNFYDVNLRVVWDSKGLVYFKTYRAIMELHNRLVKDLCRQQDMLYLPLAEQFIAGPDHFFDICHMTPKGMAEKSRILAECLAPWVTSRLNQAPPAP